MEGYFLIVKVYPLSTEPIKFALTFLFIHMIYVNLWRPSFIAPKLNIFYLENLELILQHTGTYENRLLKIQTGMRQTEATETK